MIVGIILIFGPQLYVKNTYKKYLQIASSSGLTGAEVAERILSYNGLSGTTAVNNSHSKGPVRIEAIGGQLSDHYDPRANAVRLSEENYYGRSISAIAVAAHEVGHAIQENEGYFPIKVRSTFFPVASFGDKFGIFLLMAGFIMMAWMGMYGLGQTIALAGVVAYAAVVLFQFITLPVEFDASARALQQLRTVGILSDHEIGDSKKVLTAAALTYVATALYAVINLLYWVYILFLRRN